MRKHFSVVAGLAALLTAGLAHAAAYTPTQAQLNTFTNSSSANGDGGSTAIVPDPAGGIDVTITFPSNVGAASSSATFFPRLDLSAFTGVQYSVSVLSGAGVSFFPYVKDGVNFSYQQAATGPFANAGAAAQVASVDFPAGYNKQSIFEIGLRFFTTASATPQTSVVRIAPTAVPEPTTLATLGAAGVALLGRRRRTTR